MSQKHAIIKGTFILTITGFATRFMGFFYRVFLSHTFGEEGVGLYQLIFPIYALCFSLTSAGMEVALSRCVARCATKGKHREARELLCASLVLTVLSSCIVMLLVQRNAVFISNHFLHDTRCTQLLVLLTYAFPFASIHSCICGFYFGLKQTKIPAVSQLIEQTARILSVYFLYLYGRKHGISFGISIAVAGLIIGEVLSASFCLRAVTGKRKEPIKLLSPVTACIKQAKQLITLSVPLTASRVMLNILQSIEAISIPLRLQIHGLSVSDSLSTYGVLTGMALPCVLFPSAITNSISTMLLPAVAEVQAMDNKKQLSALIKKVSCSCILLGSICCAALLCLGDWIGRFLFHSPMAGDYIATLSWMCPFLYTNNTLISIMNGIGKTNLSFFINMVSLGVRIAGVILFIPLFGIQGYLYGLLASQLCIFLFCLCYLKWYLRKY